LNVKDYQSSKSVISESISVLLSKKEEAHEQSSVVLIDTMLSLTQDCNLLSSAIQVVQVEAAVSTFADTFDVVIECSGALPGFKLATEVCTRGGSIFLKTTCASRKSIANFGFENIMEKSLRVLGLAVVHLKKRWS
jgi:threonine dehydrogenase-like Zn-dependent dehydrogenase